MEQLRQILNALAVPCITFGPLYMAWDDSKPAAFAVSFGLMVLWLNVTGFARLASPPRSEEQP